MKKLYKIASLVLFIGLLAGCEEDLIILDGESNQTFIDFASKNVNLPVEFNGTGTVTIPVNVTTKSSTARTYSVDILEGSTADPASYTLGDLVIPADSFNGSLTINGTDVNVEIDPKTLILQAVGNTGDAVGAPVTVNVFQVCPVEQGFGIGSYTLNYISGGIAATGGRAPLGNGAVVNVTQGANDPLERTFNVTVYPQFGNPQNRTRALTFGLVCGQVNFVGTVNSGLRCSVQIVFGRAGEPGSFDPQDDSLITMTFAEDTTNDCGATVTATYLLSKN